MKTYKTAEIARLMGIHPNTVRLYEKLGLIPTATRQENGYRIFTEFHVEQIRLLRMAFHIEVLQNGLRRKVVEIVKVSATGDFSRAIALTNDYVCQLQNEHHHAEEAIESVRELLSSEQTASGTLSMKRKETAQYLQVSMDALRNWEKNGLLTIKRMENGYRVYNDEDIRRLKIIRSLRCANYSLEAILGMLHALSRNPHIDIKYVLDTPQQSEDIISVCDKLITSLKAAEANAKQMLLHLQQMKERIS